MAVQNPIPLTVFENQDKGWVLNFTDFDGNPIDLTGFVVESAYMSSRGKPALGTFTLNESLSDFSIGKVVIELEPNWCDTAGIQVSKPQRVIEYQLTLDDTANPPEYVYGYLTILRSTL